MKKHNAQGNRDFDEILDRLKGLEQRVSKIEYLLKQEPSERTDLKEADIPRKGSDLYQGKGESLELMIESKVGRYGLLWVGNIVLMIGLVILSRYLINNANTGLALLIGFGSVGIIYIFSYLNRKTLPHIAMMLKTTSILLLFYFTALLHFSSATPIIPSKWICLGLLLLLNVYGHYLAFSSESRLFGLIAILLTAASAILSDNVYFMLSIAVALSLSSMYFFSRFQWKSLVIVSIFTVYALFLLWMMNNPFMGHEFQAVKQPHFNLIYLFAIAGIFSSLTLTSKGKGDIEDFIVATVLINGLGFSILLLMNVLGFYRDNYMGIFLLIFTLFFCFAIFLNIKSPWKFTAPIYVLYSFLALSIAVFGYYNIPGSFLLLAYQSLLVVTIALWFRSRFIVIMNLLLFLILLISYIVIAKYQNGINFSFALVAIITARVINWKKERLEIKTSSIRNIYLVVAFFMMLMSLYKILPDKYVALSWTGIAVVYFIVSRILNNQKYRWMSIGTLAVAAIYLLFVQKEAVNMFYRILGFISLAIVSIIISVIYARQEHHRNIENKR
ncbi:MAG: hypothetical protein GXO83_04920 [Chlorobi bacterium]|nr:hypothetical protein [Chlorobiota bacterium]